MVHELVIALQSQPEAAGFILRGIKGIFVAIGSVIAAIICAVIAGTKGRNPLGWGLLGLFFSILQQPQVIIADGAQSKSLLYRYVSPAIGSSEAFSS